MADLVSGAQKLKITELFQSLHDTLKRPITIYKNIKNEINILSNPVYNTNVLGKQNNSNVLELVNTYARIYYNEDQKKDLVDGGKDSANISVPINIGDVKIVLDEEGYNFIGKAKKITLDNEIFYIKSAPAKTGLFAVQFYTIHLTRSE